MKNKIDYVITLSNNTKLMIMDQGNYNGKSYFFTSILDKDGNLTNRFSILEEIRTEYQTTVKSVQIKNC